MAHMANLGFDASTWEIYGALERRYARLHRRHGSVGSRDTAGNAPPEQRANGLLDNSPLQAVYA